MTRQRIKDGSKYYGPYTNAAVARTVLELVRDLYPIRSCRLALTPDYISRGKSRLCLEYHMKRCGGCCVGKVPQSDYMMQIERVRQILRGDTAELMHYLRQEMERLSEQLRFEEAQELKVKYDLIARYQAKSVIVSQTIEETDVFGVDDDGKDVFINYMHVRHGAVVRSLTLHYKRRLDEPVPSLLTLAVNEISQKIRHQIS